MQKQGLLQRIVRGIGAQAFGQGATLFIQIASVPLFLHFWGKVLYAEWILLTTIPTYFTMSDLGFASAAGNEMTMRVARGDKQGTVQVFQSAWVLVTALSVSLALVCLLLIPFLPIAGWYNLQVTTSAEVRILLPLFILQVTLALQRGLIDIGYRCDGNFAAWTVNYNITRLVQFGAIAAAVALGGKAIAAAIALLIAEILCSAWLFWDLHRRSPWLHYGIRQADVSIIRMLASPALLYMGFPLGNALSLQGFATLIGITLGPTALVVFSTLRTLTRFAIQILRGIGSTVLVEFSTAFGTGDIPLARQLHRRACQVSLWLAFVLCGFLGLVGRTIYLRWTRGEVPFDPWLFGLLLLVIICNSFWSASYVVPVAANRHQRIALIFVVATTVSLVLAKVLLGYMGIYGAALALLIIETAMIFFVLPQSLQMLEDTLREFWKVLITPPGFLLTGFRQRFQRKEVGG